MNHTFAPTRREFVTAVGAGVATLAAGTTLADSTPSVGLALLGAAHLHTPMFLGILKTAPEARVLSVYDHDAARAEKTAAACEAKPARSAAEALATPGVLAAVILSETSLHAELALAATSAGKHVFIEKPLAATASDADRIAAAIEKAGLLFTSGYHLRTVPKYRFVKENVEKGNFGRLVRASCAFSNDCVLQGTFDQDCKWTVDPHWGGVGALADIGTHALDMLMWLLGDVAAVAADLAAPTHRYPGCDEIGQALLRFNNGATATLSASWIEPENPVGLLVAGTEGHATIFNDRLYLRTPKVPGADGARPWGKLPPGPDHPLLQFVHAVAGQKDQPLVTPREAAARVRVMQALYQSARERKWIALG